MFFLLFPLVGRLPLVVFLLLALLPAGYLLNVLVEFFPVVPIEVGRIGARIDPLLVHVLVPDECLHLFAVCVLARLVVAVGEPCLPVGIDDRVVHVLVHLHHVRVPLVEVD